MLNCDIRNSHVTALPKPSQNFEKKRIKTSLPTSTSPTLLAFAQLSHIELAKLCSESSSHLAWDEFYRRFDRYIRMYVKKAWKTRMPQSEPVTSCAREIMKDMVQDIYLKLIEDDQQALRSFQGKGENSFLAYLSRIANNIVAEYFRRQAAEKRKNQSFSLEMLLDDRECDKKGSRAITFTHLSHHHDLYTQVAARELTDLLWEILAGPHMHRDLLIFQLHVVEGLTIQQIASVKGIELKAGSVESIIRRTKDKLRRALQSKIAAPTQIN